MTSSLLRPRGRARTASGGSSGGMPVGAAPEGSAAPTRILDWRDPRVAALVRELGAASGHPADGGPADPVDPARQIEALHRAHAWIAAAVRPVYSVQDERPVSEVLRRGRGSCSQRLAVLEAVARAYGVPTRVRGLLVDGTFWYPRFPRLRRIVPDQVLLAWPEFRLGSPAGAGGAPAPWLTVSQLLGGMRPGGGEQGGARGGGFTNAGSETLFEALSRTAIDWDAAPAACPGTGPGAGAACDLSAYVLSDLGHYDSRDELFARHGQTLCGLARLVAEPVLGRRGAA
ncbi:transglutaminase domain-containing protein [Streptomyces erythrochromogenes]|uniref:Transglutaminase-like domain-containing protein n=1 Tax=Streptomyces erythrochromogenes TaxID=285574 RepID=A0ABZ1Q7T9_9ACTN|nr:transglutaminase domain-containing protein [Streptomyces erythrochromogenes]MCX5582112.1 transglutaminase-like domain-containing protein [Streptomyces erythrochromogenes]